MPASRFTISSIEIDAETTLAHGRFVSARAVLTFEGETLAELRAAFAETIEDYRDWRKERGVEPEKKPCSGNISLLLPPELHRRVAERADKAGESINQYIAEKLAEGG